MPITAPDLDDGYWHWLKGLFDGLEHRLDNFGRILLRETSQGLAILLWEGGTLGAKGDEYTCGRSSGPQDVRDLLGCDE